MNERPEKAVPGTRYYELETVRYDPEKGTVDTLIDEQVRHQIEIRKGIEDGVVRPAVIAELERLGYVVSSPGEAAALQEEAWARSERPDLQPLVDSLDADVVVLRLLCQGLPVDLAAIEKVSLRLLNTAVSLRHIAVNGPWTEEQS